MARRHRYGVSAQDSDAGASARVCQLLRRPDAGTGVRIPTPPAPGDGSRLVRPASAQPWQTGQVTFRSALRNRRGSSSSGCHGGRIAKLANAGTGELILRLMPLAPDVRGWEDDDDNRYEPDRPGCAAGRLNTFTLQRDAEGQVVDVKETVIDQSKS